MCPEESSAPVYKSTAGPLLQKTRNEFAAHESLNEHANILTCYYSFSSERNEV
jgi:hypothetical protein